MPISLRRSCSIIIPCVMYVGERRRMHYYEHDIHNMRRLAACCHVASRDSPAGPHRKIQGGSELGKDLTVTTTVSVSASHGYLVAVERCTRGKGSPFFGTTDSTCILRGALPRTDPLADLHLRLTTSLLPGIASFACTHLRSLWQPAGEIETSGSRPCPSSLA